MLVHHGIDAFQRLPLAVVTSGTFDGVHLGHRRILARLREATTETDGQSVVITFFPHPRLVVSDDSQDLKLLSTLDEKIALLAEAGVQHLLVIAFTKEFSWLTSEEFITRVLVDKLGTRRLIIGHDHRFGRNREGSFDYLRDHADRYGFAVEEIPRQDVEAVGVSSTRIRAALAAGNLPLANAYLGRPYSLTGPVVQGQQLGRTLGFPTANVQVPEAYKLIPADGVYAARVTVAGQTHAAMLNIGHRPTVDGTQRTIEAHLLDFSRDIYGQPVTVHLVEKLRDEQKFAGLPALQAQLALDQAAARRVLS